MMNWILKIKNWLNRWLKKEEDSLVVEVKESFLDKYKPGDVICAKMPYSDKIMSRIHPAHHYRPYLVVGQVDGRLIACPSSHKQRKDPTKLNLYCLSKENYRYYNYKGKRRKMIHNSWLRLDQLHLLPQENIVSYSYTINETDLQNIQRILLVNRNTGFQSECFEFKYIWKKGDILEKDGKNYFVLYDRNETVIVHPIESVSSYNTVRISLSDKSLWVDVSSQIELISDESCKLIDFCDAKTMIQFSEMKKNTNRKRKANTRKRANEEYMFFRHEPGTMLYDPFSDEYIVYLYDYKDRSHGVYYDEYVEGDTYSRKFVYFSQLEVHGTVDKEELFDILDILIHQEKQGDESRLKLFKIILEKVQDRTYEEEDDEKE